MQDTEYLCQVRSLLPVKMSDDLGSTIGQQLLHKRDSFVRTSDTNVKELRKRLHKLMTIVIMREVENALAEYKKLVNSNVKKYEDHEVTG